MLIDTSGFFSLQDKSATVHQIAIAKYQSAQLRITTNYILAECVALHGSRKKIPREISLRFSEEVLTDSGLEIVYIDEDLHRKAVQLLKARRDKGYSLCDATSFVLMRERKITEALTTDKHFEQEGFIRLLK